MQNSKLQISLSNASKIYFPGQVVRGEVELYLNEPLSFSVIITSISGIATIKTHGTEGSPQRNKRVRVYFEKVFQFCSLSDGVNNKNPLWNEGSHKYNFTYKLPKGIPSSFESPDGHVRYKICAFVDAAETQNQNLTDMRFFCVNSVLNLNGINKISSPKTVFKHDELSCLCIRFRTVSVVLSLMKRGFVPGENIVINAVVYNGTSSVIPRVEAKLVQFTAVQVSQVENVAIKIPVIIGNVPLLNDAKSFNTGSGDPPMAVHSLPMPNNEPCHFGPYNIVDYCGPLKYSTNYIPKYSTYSMANVCYEETPV
ncbi:arrestin domain-containing protein 17-like isoform X3 [Schistocerca gregaria]|uniref:arrestin domain-containing protein 17-like isoform X3 n=1 Tax=Schistocerca gregaria TaxID=7010 RepID=UPI00211E31F3|nr:arrestin domain-containing protein 17-like isoform X3 [Schistocerca gregaria]